MTTTCSNDYAAGLTTPIFNPATGNMVFGAAARNMRLSNIGASGYAAQAIVEVMKPVTVMMNQLQQSLDHNTKVISTLSFENQMLKNKLKKSNR